MQTSEERVMAAASDPLPLSSLVQAINALTRAAEQGDEVQARYLLGELVPSFAAVTQHTVVVPDTREWPRHERAAMAPAFQPSTN